MAKLFEEIAPAIDEAREGGYTRIVKLGNRRGDNAPLAEISLVLEAVEKKKKAAAKPAAKAEAKAEEKAEEKAAQEVEEQAAQPTAEAPEASEAPAQTEKEAE